VRESVIFARAAFAPPTCVPQLLPFDSAFDNTTTGSDCKTINVVRDAREKTVF
jgi:hypothetical protein